MTTKGTIGRADIFGWIVTLSVAALGWIMWYQERRDSQRAIIVGYVRNPAPGTAVSFDNASEPQLIDQNSGFFRFADVQEGVHNLRFDRSLFPPYSQPIHVSGVGEHGFAIKILLPPTPKGPRIGALLKTVPLQYSDDGSDPLAAILASQDPTLIYPYMTSAPAQEGWAYIGTEPGEAGSSIDLQGTDYLIVKEAVLRAERPSDGSDGGFNLGAAVGALEPGQKVMVDSLKKLLTKDSEPAMVWAQVRVIEDKAPPES